MYTSGAAPTSDVRPSTSFARKQFRRQRIVQHPGRYRPKHKIVYVTNDVAFDSNARTAMTSAVFFLSRSVDFVWLTVPRLPLRLPQCLPSSLRFYAPVLRPQWPRPCFHVCKSPLCKRIFIACGTNTAAPDAIASRFTTARVNWKINKASQEGDSDFSPPGWFAGSSLSSQGSAPSN